MGAQAMGRHAHRTHTRTQACAHQAGHAGAVCGLVRSHMHAAHRPVNSPTRAHARAWRARCPTGAALHTCMPHIRAPELSERGWGPRHPPSPCTRLGFGQHNAPAPSPYERIVARALAHHQVRKLGLLLLRCSLTARN